MDGTRRWEPRLARGARAGAVSHNRQQAWSRAPATRSPVPAHLQWGGALAAAAAAPQQAMQRHDAEAQARAAGHHTKRLGCRHARHQHPAAVAGSSSTAAAVVTDAASTSAAAAAGPRRQGGGECQLARVGRARAQPRRHGVRRLSRAHARVVAVLPVGVAPKRVEQQQGQAGRGGAAAQRQRQRQRRAAPRRHAHHAGRDWHVSLRRACKSGRAVCVITT